MICLFVLGFGGFRLARKFDFVFNPSYAIIIEKTTLECHEILHEILSQYVWKKVSSTNCLKVTSKVKDFKKWVKLKGQDHRVKYNCTHGKEYSCEILKHSLFKSYKQG